jgi:hypothetical protein
LWREASRAEGSSNPILTIIMEAVRSHNAMAAVLFIVAVGVLPAICEETLFAVFLYLLRWRFALFSQCCYRRFVLSGIWTGAFIPLFVLGFAFAFVLDVHAA